MTRPDSVSVAAGADQQAALDDLRQRIDQIDQKIVDLLMQRMKIVAHVASQKIQTGIVFRPRREMQKHAMLQQFALQHNLPPRMLFDLWRTIMTQASLHQRAFSLWLGDQQLKPLACEYFGGFQQSPKICVCQNNTEAMIQQAARYDSSMAIIATENLTLTHWTRQLGSTSHIVTRLPWDYADAASFPMPDSGKTPIQAYVVASCPYDLQSAAQLVLAWPRSLELPDNDAVCGVPTACHDGWLLHWYDDNAYNNENELRDYISRTFPAAISLLGRIPVLNP